LKSSANQGTAPSCVHARIDSSRSCCLLLRQLLRLRTTAREPAVGEARRLRAKRSRPAASTYRCEKTTPSFKTFRRPRPRAARQRAAALTQSNEASSKRSRSHTASPTTFSWGLALGITTASISSTPSYRRTAKSNREQRIQQG